MGPSLTVVGGYFLGRYGFFLGGEFDGGVRNLYWWMNLMEGFKDPKRPGLFCQGRAPRSRRRDPNSSRAMPNTTRAMPRRHHEQSNG